MFAYELPFSGIKNSSDSYYFNEIKKVSQPSVVVYNFHSIFFHKRLYIFTQHNQNILTSKVSSNYYTLNSITELFPAGN
jgi:hypothetical protein